MQRNTDTKYVNESCYKGFITHRVVGREICLFLFPLLSNTRLELAVSPALHGLCRRWVWLRSSTTRNCRKRMYLHAFISVVVLHSIFPVPSAPSNPPTRRHQSLPFSSLMSPCRDGASRSVLKLSVLLRVDQSG